MTNGFIYVLLNPSIPNMVKIGQTKTTSEKRARAISSATGVPTDFIVLYDALVSDVEKAEEEIHTHFSGYRPNKRREFFNVPPKLAIRALIDIAHKYPIAPVLPTTIDDVLPMLKSRFPKFLDPNIFSARIITIPGACYLKVGRMLNGLEEYSEEELPLDGLKTPETITPEVVEYNAKLLGTLNDYDWIMISNIFPQNIAVEIAKEWEGPGGKLEIWNKNKEK